MSQIPPANRIAVVFNELLVATIVTILILAWIASLAGLASGPLAWLILRATGTLAYLALAISASLGALLSSQYAPAWLTRAAQFGWHGLLSGFALAISLIHGAFLLVDGKYRQPLEALFVPGMSSFKPLEVGLGTLCLYMLLLVYISSVVKKRLSARVWRGLHLLSYPAFILATLHGSWTGSDGLTLLYSASSLAVLTTFALRIAATLKHRSVLGQRTPIHSTIPRPATTFEE